MTVHAEAQENIIKKHKRVTILTLHHSALHIRKCLRRDESNHRRRIRPRPRHLLSGDNDESSRVMLRHILYLNRTKENRNKIRRQQNLFTINLD